MRPTIYTLRVHGRWVQVECAQVYPRGWVGTVIGLPDGESVRAEAATLVDLMERVRHALGDDRTPEA